MATLVLAGCVDGHDPADDSTTATACHAAAECTVEGETCLDADPFRVCGVAPRELCGSDDDCGEGLRCHAIDDQCSADGVGSTCDAPCTAGSCGAGFTCDDGACRADSCATAASLCTAWEVCDPGTVSTSAPVYNQHHGCVTVACTTSATCPTGLECVNDVCQTGPGECGVFLAVP